MMSTGDLLNIQPSEFKFPFELRKQSSCSMQLINKSDQYVAFKVKVLRWSEHGIVLPGSTCNVTVTMQAPKEAPPDMQCKAKILIQCVIAPNGTTTKNITSEMFDKEDGKVIEEFKLRVVYIANPPSPVPEGSEEGSPEASMVDNRSQNSSLPDAVTKSLMEPTEKPFGNVTFQTGADEKRNQQKLRWWLLNVIVAGQSTRASGWLLY